MKYACTKESRTFEAAIFGALSGKIEQHWDLNANKDLENVILLQAVVTSRMHFFTNKKGQIGKANLLSLHVSPCGSVLSYHKPFQRRFSPHIPVVDGLDEISLHAHSQIYLDCICPIFKCPSISSDQHEMTIKTFDIGRIHRKHACSTSSK